MTVLLNVCWIYYRLTSIMISYLICYYFHQLYLHILVLKSITKIAYIVQILLKFKQKPFVADQHIYLSDL